MNKPIVNSDGASDDVSGEKVDTTPQNEEDAGNQNKAEQIMGVADESGSEVVEDQKEDDDTVETQEEEVEEDEVKEVEEDPDSGYIDTDKKEEDTKDKTEEKSAVDVLREEMNEKLTQSQSEAIRLKNELDKLKSGNQSDAEADESKEMQKDFISFCSSHGDVLGAEIVEDYKKFIDSGNNAFIFNNPKLKSLAEAIEDTNESLPFATRIDKAFKIAFSDEIADLRGKQEKVKTEIKNQEINKSSAGGNKSAGNKKSAFTPEQMDIADKMGVELD